MRRWGLAALLVVGLLTLLFRPPALLGQSGGPFIRATCSQINSPTTGESVCFNSTRGEWQTWTGSAWVAISGASNSVMNGVLFVTATGTTTNAGFLFDGTSLFLPSGGVVNWANGDVTLTHSANALTLAGGPLLLPDGTAAAPSVARDTDPATGMYFLGTVPNTVLAFATEGVQRLTISATVTTFDALRMGISTGDVWLSRAAAGHAKVTTDGSTLGTWSASVLYADGAKVTAGSGTGVTVNETATVRSVVYKVTVLSTNCIAAAVTCDLTIATLPAKTFLKSVFVDLTTTYACTATCTTATLSGTLGTTAGGTQLLASMDLDAATTQFGDADAELGATMNAAARSANGALFNGVLMSWSATTTVTYRITSGTGNLGDGAATNLSQGAMVFYLVTEVFP